MDRSSVTNIPDQDTINNNYALYGDNNGEDLGSENDGDDHDSGISFSDDNDELKYNLIVLNHYEFF